MTTALNGVNVGTISDKGEDLDIIVKYAQFTKTVDPDAVMSHTFTYAGKVYRLGDLLDVNITNAIASIKREAGLTTITIGADVEDGILATDVQAKFLKFASAYSFPSGISYAQG
jgi:multidrug efflux pump subunit AcrB